MKILVASCDKNLDLCEPFHHCMEKYWPDHPEIIYSMETLTNPYYKTINKNYDIDHWTKRIRETLQEIDDDQILLMCDDVFIRSNVDTSRIKYLESILKTNDIASINLEKTFDNNDEVFNDLLMKRSLNGNYKLSVMCNFYNKDKLLNILNTNLDPWTFEITNKHLGYTYLVCKEYALDWGPKCSGVWFGIQKGKWCKECKDFFDKENIKINYYIRGIVND